MIVNSWQQFLQWKHIRSHQRRDPNMWVTTPVLTSSSTSSLNSLPFTWIPLHLVVLSNSCRHVLGSDERIRKYQHHRGWHAQKHHGILVLNVLTAAIVFSWFLHLSLSVLQILSVTSMLQQTVTSLCRWELQCRIPDGWNGTKMEPQSSVAEVTRCPQELRRMLLQTDPWSWKKCLKTKQGLTPPRFLVLTGKQ